MARKQQRNFATAKRTLDEIHSQRVALQAKIQEIQADVEALVREHAALQDTKVVQHTRRKLRYPSV